MAERVSIGRLARETGLPQTTLRRLANEGAIPSERTQGGHRRFDVDAVRQALVRAALPRTQLMAERMPGPTAETRLEIPGKPEHEIWAEAMQGLNLDPSSPAARTIHYAFTEMMNNAIEHSMGSAATVRWWADDDTIAFEIADNGVGAFERVRLGLRLEDTFAAIQELTKGKTTTDPDNHTGEGVFFTSKCVDVFEISANGLSWVVDNLRDDQTVDESDTHTGTRVFCRVDRNTRKVPSDVFDQFTVDFEFSKTKTIVKLFELGVAFVSRSEARRLMMNLDRFKEVELDFRDVEMVGQGFVDEVFRVWANAHPDVALVPTHMSRPVELMVRRGLPPR